MRVLVIAPHPDDEILGVGGTIAKYVSNGHQVYVCIVTRGSSLLFDEKGTEEVRGETKKVHEYLSIKKTFFLDFPAVMLEEIPRYKLNGEILRVVREVKPEIVYIPHFGDMQKDHRMVADAAMVAIRPKNDFVIKGIYSYETLSETEWNIPNSMNAFIPNSYQDISQYMDKKLNALSMYGSQMGHFPNPRSAESVTALAKYRGSNVNVMAAEAFSVVREIII